MKYSSTDRLQDFEFHDSEFSFVSWNCLLEHQWLCISAKHLNVHKDAAPNHSGSDMEIREALITFYDFEMREFEPARAWQRDENGNLYTDDPLVIYTGAEAHDLFISELKKGICIAGITQADNKHELFASSDPMFFARFTFSQVKIKWDDYSQKAWYELKKTLDTKISLATPGGDVDCPISINYQHEDTYAASEEKDPTVSIVLQFDHREFYGHGTDYLWTDAFANLQKSLPDGVTLKCCLSCKHGNMCPCGNFVNEVFCTQDVQLSEMSDLYHYVEDWEERDNRSRHYTYVCKNYQEQTADCILYNDYPLQLKK